MSDTKQYLSYEEFYDKLVGHLPVGESWKLECEDGEYPDDEDYNYVLTFTKHQYEAENGCMYDFIVYSCPKTLDAGLIQENTDGGWGAAISEVWFDITETCNLKPFVYKH